MRSRTTTPACRASRPVSFVGRRPRRRARPRPRGPGRARTVRTSRPSRRRLEAVEHVLVGVAGERAAVVPGDGEGARAHVVANPWSAEKIPGPTISGQREPPSRRHTRVATAPRARPIAAPATTSEAWWTFTYTRLVATTPARPNHNGASRPAFGEHHGGEEGRRGVATREAARERPAQPVWALAFVDRADPAEQRLHAEVHERRLDAEGDGEAERSACRHPGRPRERVRQCARGGCNRRARMRDRRPCPPQGCPGSGRAMRRPARRSGRQSDRRVRRRRRRLAARLYKSTG